MKKPFSHRWASRYFCRYSAYSASYGYSFLALICSILSLIPIILNRTFSHPGNIAISLGWLFLALLAVVRKGVQELMLEKEIQIINLQSKIERLTKQNAGVHSDVRR